MLEIFNSKELLLVSKTMEEKENLIPPEHSTFMVALTTCQHPQVYVQLLGGRRISAVTNVLIVLQQKYQYFRSCKVQRGRESDL